MQMVFTCAFAGMMIVTNVATPSQPTDDASSLIADQYRETAKRIIEATLAQNDGYMKLQELCDGIGHRLSGSPQLDQAIHWAADAMRQDGQDNVRIEKVMVPHWVRGDESLMMLQPRRAPVDAGTPRTRTDFSDGVPSYTLALHPPPCARRFGRRLVSPGGSRSPGRVRSGFR